MSSPLDLFKVSKNYSTLSSRVKVGGPARKPEKRGGGGGGGGEGELATGRNLRINTCYL